ncbi:condensation domain-containing protein [Micromonospora siamensis]|uniref:condensation domain-containing protein n=1 Tax=Micromonospora siamensis TaxID=299152 RepID=UPI0012FDBC61|nr:condensation domain-containing protein [Micromonospora siamensis]
MELASQPDACPLSSTQQLWCAGDLGDDAGSFSPRFLSTRAIRISGRLDVDALQRALDDLVERHEILRTVVVRDADPKYQQVLAPVPVPLDVRDVTPIAGQSRDVQAETLAQEAMRSSLDPRVPPLLRSVLVRLDDNDSILVLVAHHTAADGWSMQLLLRDLSVLYAAHLAGRNAALPPVTQYREFVAWEHERITGPAAEAAMSYWREKLRGGEAFALPTDRPIPERHTRAYSASYFNVDAEVITAAAELARSMRSSLFFVLMAAFSVVAHKITGTTDPIFNAISAGRNDVQSQNVVGSIMNILPLRTDISDCATFREVMAKTRQTCVEAYTYELPVRQIVDEMPGIVRPKTDPWLCEVFVTMSQPQVDENDFQFGSGSYQIRKWVIDEPEASGPPEGFAWIVDVLPSGELTGHVLYNTDEIDESNAVGWAASYCQVLAAGVGAPDRDWRTL